jgi:putative hydrolase of the HAD superfamily
MVIVFDLDDTLYDEIDFVKSGFLEVSKYLKNEKFFDFMWEEFKKGNKKVFDTLIKKFNLNIKVEKLIEIYRFHNPNIFLPNKKLASYADAIITDGHYIMQKNKYLALNLDVILPIFTDFYHTSKPDIKPFKMVEEYFRAKKYVYIADNPKKDFFAPKELNWLTIRFKNPNGIYNDIENNADIEVTSREEIIKIISSLKKS